VLETTNPLVLIVGISALAILPLAAMLVTSFTKIVIVLSLLRNALGLQQVPPNMVMSGLAMILSAFIMYPVGVKMSAAVDTSSVEASKPLTIRSMTENSKLASEPLGQFLYKHSSPSERAFFLSASKTIMPPEVALTLGERDLIILIPSFVATELTEAFKIGFLIFLPFIIIDLIVANVLVALGMQMMSPVTVSLPFKLLLFVLLDGWSRLLHALVLSYK
jgi:type III secretion protein R